MSSSLAEGDRAVMAGKLVNRYQIGLLVAGALFTVTACAYAVAVVRLDQHARSGVRDVESGFVAWMDHYGTWLLFGELAALGVMTAGLVGTDDSRSKRAGGGPDGDAASEPANVSGISDEVMR
ncbi:MAG: hypothetical protein FJ297_16735 [Planctomycetes bacterium]|nr:hypothetical protein [Planctomycetota bacterium]